MPFHFPKTMISKPFFSNNINIDTATLTYTGSLDQVQFSLGLSATYGGTYIWEDVDPADVHSFTTTGVWAKWRAVGLNGSISEINIAINPD